MIYRGGLEGMPAPLSNQLAQQKIFKKPAPSRLVMAGGLRVLVGVLAGTYGHVGSGWFRHGKESG